MTKLTYILCFLAFDSGLAMTPHLNIKIDGITIREVSKVLGKVRPTWQIRKVQRKVFSQALTNSLAAFYTDSIEDPDAIVIRSNGAGTGDFLDRQAEVKI